LGKEKNRTGPAAGMRVYKPGVVPPPNRGHGDTKDLVFCFGDKKVTVRSHNSEKAAGAFSAAFDALGIDPDDCEDLKMFFKHPGQGEPELLESALDPRLNKRIVVTAYRTSAQTFTITRLEAGKKKRNRFDRMASDILDATAHAIDELDRSDGRMSANKRVCLLRDVIFATNQRMSELLRAIDPMRVCGRLQQRPPRV